MDLSINKIEEIPPEIEKMAELKNLSLRRNLIEKLPESLLKLDKLRMLEVDRTVRNVPNRDGLVVYAN